MGFLFPVMYLRCWCRRYVILQKQLCIYLNSKGEVVPKDGESWNCNTLDPPAGINPYMRASVRFDICLCEGHPAHWQGLSWSSSSYLTPAWQPGSLCRMFQRLFHCGLVRTRVDPWQGRAVVSRGWPLSCPVVLPAPWQSPAVTSSGTLKYRLCGVFLCQRTEQFCANWWASPMQLASVNRNHILDYSRNCVSSLWLQTELPHQLRKQPVSWARVCWSLHSCNTVPPPVNVAILMNCKQHEHECPRGRRYIHDFLLHLQCQKVVCNNKTNFKRV